MTAVLDLPRDLLPWQPWLQVFDPEIAAMLGDLLLRLDPLLGSGISQVQHAPATADGYSGVAARGSYERLLLSEWGLADAMPDEFIRRAAQGEHLFLAPQFHQVRNEPCVVALFDAGPRQWGEPRLVHVAMWILLQRRARDSRARLLWGVLHRPGELHDASAQDMLLKLLHARSHEAAGPAQCRDWAVDLQEQQPGVAELWLLAADSSAAQVLCASHVVRARRTFDAALQVALGPAARPRELTLPLPAPMASSRLLQGQWLQVVKGDRVMSTASRLSLRQPPQFSSSGRNVAVAFAEGQAHSACILRIGHENQRKPPILRLQDWTRGQRMLCAHVGEKNLGGVVGDDAHLGFWQLPGGVIRRPSADALTIHPGVGRWLPAIEVFAGHDQRNLHVVDNAGRLLQWSRKAGGTPELVRLAEVVVAMREAGQGELLFAQYRAAEVVISRRSRLGKSKVIIMLPGVRNLKNVWLAAPRSWSDPLCFALEQPDGDGGRLCGFYRVERETVVDRQDVRLAPGSKVIGLLEEDEQEASPRLLVLGSDRRSLMLIHPQGQRMLHRSPVAVATASVSPCGRRLAWVDIDGRLQVMTVAGRSLLTLLDGRRGASNG